MHTKKVLAAFALSLGLSLALLWSMDAMLAIAAPTANLTVTKFTDSADGVCDSDCSLREAVIAAGLDNEDDTIELGSGTYVLTSTVGVYPERGDLDIMSSYALTITGNGPQNTFINANGIDRAIYIHDGVPTVVISGVTIYGGATINAGGGIYHRGGDLILINVAVISNTTPPGSGVGGGGVSLVGSDAVLTLDENCLVAGNEADYGGGISASSGARVLLGGGQVVSNSAVYGGGVYAYQSSVTMNEVQIVSNTASYKGGGVFIQNSIATLNGGAILSNTAGINGGGLLIGGTFTQTGQSIIAHNTAYTRGGGIYVEFGTAVLNDGQIIHNQVTDASADWHVGGGGAYVASSAALIQTGSSAIVENSAATHGGGVYVDGGSVTLDGGQILSNTAGKSGGGVYLYSGSAFTQTAGLIAYNEAQGTDTYEGGGGLFSSGSTNLVSLNGGQIMENQANKGGGLYVRSGSFDLLGAEIVSNHAIQSGGGVYAGTVGWSVLLEGGRIMGNTAEYGGGLYATAGYVTLERGQIVDNRASLEGGGVYHDTDGNTFYELTLINTTISGNTASSDGSALVNASGTTILTYTTVANNIIDPPDYGIQKHGGVILAKNTIVAYNGDDNCASDAVTSNDHNLDSDGTCGFAEPKDQSGVDPQLAPLADDLGTLVHAIESSSPARDAGVCQANIITDQRGVPRLSPCDVGAYEYGQIYTLTVAKDGTGIGTVDPSLGVHNYLSGTVVPITASAGLHSTFDGWSGAGCSGTGDCVVTMDASKQVTATFTLITYTLDVNKAGDGDGTVSSTPAGIDCGTDCSESFVEDTVVSLTATASTGSIFGGWSGAGCSGTGDCAVTMDATREITATFVIAYDIYLPLVIRNQ